MDRLGDFTGFTFNGVHSSTLGIYRIIEANRMDIKLTPSIKDNVIDVPGADYEVFFNSLYKETKFLIPIAFDGISEIQFRRFREFYNSRTQFPLIFDENPYKVYIAKGDGAANIKYVCFEDKGVRTYSGEAQLQFTCFSPFASSRYNFTGLYDKANVVEWQDVVNEATIMQKDIDTPTDTGAIFYEDDGDATLIIDDMYTHLDNLDEWIEASDIVDGQYNIPYVEDNKVKIKIYNSGDLQMGISIRLEFVDGLIPQCGLWNSDNDANKLVWSNIIIDNAETRLKSGKDKYVEIRTKDNVAMGQDEAFKDTGRNYIQYFRGSFILAPKGESELVFSNEDILPYIKGISYKFRYF